MWINCYASIYPKNAVSLYMHENRLNVELCRRRFASVARKGVFCFVSYFPFFDFFLTDRKSATLETKIRIILNGAPSHAERVKIMSVQRDTA